MANRICDFILSRQWSVYPFIPPVFALLLSVFLVPAYEKLLSENLKGFLRTRNIEDRFELIDAIVKARSLQIAYLTEVPVFAVSVVSVIEARYPAIPIIIIVLGSVLVLVTAPKLFLKDSDFISTTKFPEKGWPKFVADRNYTYDDFYSVVLACLNLILIVVLILALPSWNT